MRLSATCIISFSHHNRCSPGSSKGFGLMVTPKGLLSLYNAMGLMVTDMSYNFEDSLDRWVHMALVIATSEGTITLYIDGEEAATAGCNNCQRLADECGKMVVGAGLPLEVEVNTVTGLKGGLAELKLWSVPKKKDDIKGAMSRSSLTGSEEHLKGWWRFDEGDGIIIYDGR